MSLLRRNGLNLTNNSCNKSKAVSILCHVLIILFTPTSNGLVIKSVRTKYLMWRSERLRTGKLIKSGEIIRIVILAEATIWQSSLSRCRKHVLANTWRQINWRDPHSPRFDLKCKQSSQPRRFKRREKLIKLKFQTYVDQRKIPSMHLLIKDLLSNFLTGSLRHVCICLKNVNRLHNS